MLWYSTTIDYRGFITLVPLTTAQQRRKERFDLIFFSSLLTTTVKYLIFILPHGWRRLRRPPELLLLVGILAEQRCNFSLQSSAFRQIEKWNQMPDGTTKKKEIIKPGFSGSPVLPIFYGLNRFFLVFFFSDNTLDPNRKQGRFPI